MSKPSLQLIVDKGPKRGETLERKAGAVIRIGRVVKGNTFSIKEPSISQKHLSIEFISEISQWAVKDLDTSTGTFLNDARIPCSAPFPLSDGDTIKIGETTSVTVKISAVDEKNLEAAKRNGEKGRGRLKKSADSVRVSKKDDILDTVVEDRTEAPENLGRGRRGNSARVSKKDEILDLDGIEAPKNLGRGGRTNSTMVSEKDEILDLVVKDSIEVPKNLGRGRRTNSSRVLKKDEILDSIMEDRTAAPENLGRGRRGNSARISKKDEILDLDSIEAPKNLGRGRRTNSTMVSEKDEILDLVVEDSIQVPKNLGRGRRTNSSRVLKKNEILDSITEDRTAAPENLGRGRRRNSARISKKDEILDLDSIEAPKNLGRGRRTNSTTVSEKDEILDLVVEDSIEVPKNFGRGRRTNSNRVLKKDEILDSIMEDRTEAPKNLGKGRRTKSTKVSKKDEILDLVVEDSVQVPKNVGRGRRRRAPAWTRASSARVLKDEEILNPVENLYQWKELREGSHQLGQSEKIQQISLTSSSPKGSKDKRSPSRETFDKENYGPVKSQRSLTPLSDSREKVLLSPENTQLVVASLSQWVKPPPTDDERRKLEYITMKNCCSERNPDGDRPISGIVAPHWNNDEPSCVLPKCCGGNGIPNTTSKYKEDQKVSWHATPFEERLEKALSDDKLFPQRKLTS